MGKTKKHWAITGTAAIIMIGLIGYFALGNQAAPDLIKVVRGDITQEVTITGKTKPAKDVDLAFEKSGRVVAVGAEVGDHVTPGQMLVQQDASDLLAQLKEAEGALASQQAKLDEVRKGSRPEDIEIAQTSLAKANQDLANYYNSVPDTLNDAFAKAEDAIRKQTDDMFSGTDKENNGQLAFSTTNSQAKIDSETKRIVVGQSLNAWKTDLSNINSATNAADLDELLVDSSARLATMRDFINRLNEALLGQTSLSSATVATYKSEITTARSSLNTALSAVSAISQNIASQKITVRKSENELALKKAGSTPEAIKSQAALVTQAQGNVDSIRAQIGKTTLRAPITGIVTKQDAKLGTLAPAGTIIVSVISDTHLEIEANVPEIDIGKIALGNPVRVTLDAFPGETFTGTVATIDPAETIIDGVVNYKIAIAFTKEESRVKTGLTANLEIETIKKSGVLVIPQYAILENDNGSFVRKTKDGGKTYEEIAIKIGIRDVSGMVEVTSGVDENDMLSNIGNKSK